MAAFTSLSSTNLVIHPVAQTFVLYELVGTDSLIYRSILSFFSFHLELVNNHGSTLNYHYFFMLTRNA